MAVFVFGSTPPQYLFKNSSLLIADWKEFLSTVTDEQKVKKIRLHENTGRPLGNKSFVKGPEKLLNRSLNPLKPGPKRKDRR